MRRIDNAFSRLVMLFFQARFAFCREAASQALATQKTGRSALKRSGLNALH